MIESSQAEPPGASSEVRAIYGRALLSRGFRLLTHLAPAGQPADLVFTCSPEEPVDGSWRAGAPVFSSPNLDERGESAARLHRGAGFEVLGFARLFDFYLWPERRPERIHCRLLDPGARPYVELRLLGPVMAYLLEREGQAALHGSAVMAGGRAVAFLGDNRSGKTTLAAELLRAGLELLSDDILPLGDVGGTARCRAGFPEMRMWPDAAARYAPEAHRLPRVHPELEKRRVRVGAGGLGRFHPGGAQLGAIYLPRRRTASEDPGRGVEIAPVSPGEALVELVRNSFSPYIVDGLGWQPRRLDLFARLLRGVPIRSLSYPPGFEHLPEVARAVLDDLRE